MVSQVNSGCPHPQPHGRFEGFYCPPRPRDTLLNKSFSFLCCGKYREFRKGTLANNAMKRNKEESLHER